MISDSAILKHIERQPKRQAGFKQLVREMHARGDDRRLLEERLERMVKSGSLVELNGRYALPKAVERQNQALGELSMHRDGFGFVTPDDRRLRERISGDIYIPPRAIGEAMHGDRVLVEIGQIRPDGRAEGRILKVAGRKHDTVVGIFHYGDRYNYVSPMDDKINEDIIIPRGSEWPDQAPATVEAAESDRPVETRTRHRVIGSEARRRTEFKDLEKVVVDVEITEWPTPTQSARGKVIEILGYEDDFGVDVEIIIRKHHLPHRFPDEAIAEAQSVETTIAQSELRRRRDFRDLPIVTIDGETARDFDDAVAVFRLENGNYELQVHIADVAHYVRPDTPLDREARLRGNSVYFPDRAVPMLPLELSTDICSLRPRVDRLVLSCIMEIDQQGEIVQYEICEGVIRSAERMTYTDVNLILEGDDGLRRKYRPLVEHFELLGELAQILNRKRVKRGSIDFDLPEPVIEFNEQGMMEGVSRSERNQAHRLIEEFMLAANEAVAGYLEGKNIASIYRVHEQPDAKKVYDFEVLAAAFGYSLGVGALPIKRVQIHADRRARHGSGRNPRPVEIPQEVHITPRMYQKLTQKIAGKPEERILSYLMLRSLKQARYSEESLGHFALATDTYTHFTSPIRRYPDLIVHRVLKDALRESAEDMDGEVPVGVGWGAQPEGKRSPWSRRGEKARGRKQHERDGRGRHLGGPMPIEELQLVADETSQTERRAEDAERELLEWKKIKFMQDRIGEEFPALIVSVTKFGFFVELFDLFIEGLVPLSTLVGDRFTYRDNTRQIIGERTKKSFSLGDTVRVILDRIDYMQRKLQFAVLEEKPPLRERRRKKAARR